MGNNRARYLVDEHGKKKGVLLPVARYRRMLEDLHDLAVVAERRTEVTRGIAKMQRCLRPQAGV